MFIVYQYKFKIILEAPTEGRNNVSCTVAAGGHLRYCHRLSTAFRQQDIRPRWRGIRICQQRLQSRLLTTAPVYKSPCRLGLSCCLRISVTLRVSPSPLAFDSLVDQLASRSHIVTNMLNVCYTVRSESRCALMLRYGTVQACIDARGHHFHHLLLSAQRLPERRSAESVCKLNYTGSSLYRRSWTPFPTPFISEQRLSERTVLSPMTKQHGKMVCGKR
jgi:hypothetical protein